MRAASCGTSTAIMGLAIVILLHHIQWFPWVVQVEQPVETRNAKVLPEKSCNALATQIGVYVVLTPCHCTTTE
jgi:hypothetical protein